MNTNDTVFVSRKDRRMDSTKPTPLQLRLPEDLKIYLRSQAAINHRSLNGELVYRLEESRRRGDQATGCASEPK